MATWQGFSDLELQRLKGGGSQRAGNHARRTESGESRATGWRREGHTQTTSRQHFQRSRQHTTEPRSHLDEEEESKERLKGSTDRLVSNKGDAPLVQVQPVLSSSGDPDQSHEFQESQVVEAPVESLPLKHSKEERISFDCPASSLEDLQRRQHEIEEENKRKKAILEKAVQERYLQSQVEVRKLHVVKEELDRLDCLVTRDVSILRDRIEEASRDYNSARRRFEEAEREYIESKVHLYRASEVKELLSEHLCAVIQHNEARKSNKLEELMSKLQMDGSNGREGSGRVKSESGVLTDVGTLLRTPTPGISVWPALSKKQTNASTTNGVSGIQHMASIQRKGDDVPVPTAVADQERGEDNEAKQDELMSEPQLVLAANGNVLADHSEREKSTSTATVSNSDIALVVPRMD